MSRLFRGAVFGFIWGMNALLALTAAPAFAQICENFPGVAGTATYFSRAGTLTRPANCNGLRRCYTVENDAPTAEALGGCDPANASCTVRASIDLRFPGNQQNPSQAFYTHVTFDWRTSAGATIAQCGNPLNRILDDFAETTLEVGFSCADYAANPASGTYTVHFTTCPAPVSGACRRTNTVTVDLAQAGDFCPPPPRPWSCNEEGSCQAGCMGPNGSGAGGEGAGGSSAAGGGPGLGGESFGPAAFLRYQAGGVGVPSQPITNDWTATLGRYWSHDYAERIVPDPDDSRVWLLTRHATFREFIDANLDGGYESGAAPVR